MSPSSTGKSPVVLGDSPKLPVPPKARLQLAGVRRLFQAALDGRPGGQSASKQIADAGFTFDGKTITVRTKLSPTLLPMVFNAPTMQILESALAEHGHSDISIEYWPLSERGTLAPPERPVTNVPPPPAAISAPLQRLADSAAKLNSVSDELTKHVEQIDAALKRLNLGVTAWVTISQSEDEDGNCSGEKLGYARIGSRWGMALRTYEGVRGDPNPPDETFSAFADAPRQLRIRAVEHIPKLLDQLSTEAEAMIANLSPKLDEIGELTSALRTTTEVKK